METTTIFQYFIIAGIYFVDPVLAINFPRKEWSIRYSDIADVQSGPMKNLIIIAKSGASDVFVVNKKQKWIDDIKHRMQSA